MHYSKFVAKILTIVYRFRYEKLFPVTAQRVAENRRHLAKGFGEQDWSIAILRYLLAEGRKATDGGKYLFDCKKFWGDVGLFVGA